MKVVMSLAGYLSIACATTGITFKVQHWPGAAILLLVGVFLLNFVYLPMHFYQKAKS